MNVTETVTRIVPTLKCNNRRLALAFFEGDLGMKNLLEDGAWTSLGDGSKLEKLTLEEAPSNRTRRVNGPKKLAKLIIKVAEASEIESLLARGLSYTKLYQGTAGYAFEALSPEGDLVLLHAEDRLDKLVEIESATFTENPDFAGLSQFDIQQVQLHVPSSAVSQDFYQQVLPAYPGLAFVESQGADLQVPVSETWDLCQLKFVLTDFNGPAFQEEFPAAFLPKSGKFLIMDDPSQIELWFEGL